MKRGKDMSFLKRLKEKFTTDHQAKEKSNKYKSGLEKTRDNFSAKLNNLLAHYRAVDEDFFEELEELLISADVGVNTVMELTEELEFEVKRQNIKKTEQLKSVITEKLVSIYTDGNQLNTELNLLEDGLSVILVVGVNGVGKTTTIGKLAYQLKERSEERRVGKERITEGVSDE